MSGRHAEDDRRFNEAFGEHWTSVFRFAVAWTNDLYSADEISQEAFTRLWDRRSSVDWERPVVPWLLVVTRRLATDRFRRLRSPFAQPHVRDLGEDGIASWLDVQAAFGRLSARERAALVSVAILGFSPDEVSDALGMTPGPSAPRSAARARSWRSSDERPKA